MKPLDRAVLCALAAVLVLPPVADAQGTLGRIRERARQEADQRAPANRPADADQEEAEDRPATADAAPAAAAPASARPGEGAWANYDFVPGERVIFAEDLTRDRVGNFPQRFEFLGGMMEIVESRGQRWMQASEGSRFAVRLSERLPERFTIEYDITVPANWESILFFSGDGVDELNASPGGACCYVPTSAIAVTPQEVGVRRGADSGLTSSRSLYQIVRGADGGVTGMPLRVRVHADGRYVKVYANEVRVANVPNLEIPRGNTLYFDLNAQDDVPILFGNLSVNAGGRGMYDALAADGRVATQGILFDTGSDRIRPESTPTLGEILAMLRERPALRILIEGHTDDVGQKAANQSLSERRAAAVKSHLVAQGIDAGRLEAAGFGDSRPRAGNDSPEGRQTNRRVELVRL
jgi:OmpA-OmpF porin, OOP family